MFRILILFLIFYIIYKIIKKFFSTSVSNNNQPQYQKKINGEKVLPCTYCNVYVPESKGKIYKGKFFCSNSCIKQFQEKEKNEKTSL